MEPFRVKSDLNGYDTADVSVGHGSVSGDSLASWGTSIFGDRMELNEEERTSSVLVTNIPPGVSTDKVIIHFQSRRFGGGDVKSVLRPYGGMDESKALVIFYEVDVAEGVVGRVHIINKILLQVEPLPPPEDTKIFTEVFALLDKSIRSKLKSDLTQVFEEVATQADVEVTVKKQGYILKAREVDQLREAEGILRHHCGLGTNVPERIGDLNIRGTPIDFSPSSTEASSLTLLPPLKQKEKPHNIQQRDEYPEPSRKLAFEGTERYARDVSTHQGTSSQGSKNQEYKAPYFQVPPTFTGGFRRTYSDNSQNTDDEIEAWSHMHNDRMLNEKQQPNDLQRMADMERVELPEELDGPDTRSLTLVPSYEEEHFLSAASEYSSSEKTLIEREQATRVGSGPGIMDATSSEGKTTDLDDSKNSRINPDFDNGDSTNSSSLASAVVVKSEVVREHLTYDSVSSSSKEYTHEEYTTDKAVDAPGSNPMPENVVGAVGGVPDQVQKVSLSLKCSDELMVDADFYTYLVEVKYFELETIQRDHNVKIMDVKAGDQVKVFLMANEQSVPDEEVNAALNKFGSLYQHEFMQSVREVCEVQDDHDKDVLQVAYEKVKNMYTNILIRQTSDRMTEFIGDSILAKQARHDFIEHAGIRGTTRGRGRRSKNPASDIHPSPIAPRAVDGEGPRLEKNGKVTTFTPSHDVAVKPEEDLTAVKTTQSEFLEGAEHKTKPKTDPKSMDVKKGKKPVKEYKSIRHLNLKKVDGTVTSDVKMGDRKEVTDKPGRDEVDGFVSGYDQEHCDKVGDAAATDVPGTKVSDLVETDVFKPPKSEVKPVKLTTERTDTYGKSAASGESVEIEFREYDQSMSDTTHQAGGTSPKTAEDEASEAYIRELLRQEKEEREAHRRRRKNKQSNIIDRHQLGKLSAQVDEVIQGKHPDSEVILESWFRGGGRPGVSRPSGEGTAVTDRRSEEGSSDGSRGKSSVDSSRTSSDSSSANSGAVSHNAPQKNECTICQGVADPPKQLACGHVFCKPCIELQFANYKAQCPNCAIEPATEKLTQGPQPTGGTMEHVIDEKHHLSGHSGEGTIVIKYFFHPGKQTADDPFPGEKYSGLRRTAYLPNSQAGRIALDRLHKAFLKRLTFKLVPIEGNKNGAAGLVWNITHKTELGGEKGYPDPRYLGHVKQELDQLGIDA